MDCETARDLLPIRDRAGVDPEDRDALDRHLADCRGCRDEAEHGDAAAVLLREYVEELSPDIPEPDEIHAMLCDREFLARPRHLRHAAAAAFVLVAAGLLVWSLQTSRSGVNRFAAGPQVPEGQLVLDPPELGVLRTPAWDGETRRAVFGIRGETVEARLSFDPGDGGPRVRQLRRREDAPAPGGAILLLADAGETWRNVLRAACEFGADRSDLYLGGSEPGGTLGAVALALDPPAEFRRLGEALTPTDLDPDGREPEAFLELRITRTREGIRYRWGHFPELIPGRKPWSAGDTTLLPEAVEHRAAPILTKLARSLNAARLATDAGPRTVVWLEVGEGVRYVDVLRAVECGGGNPEVCFVLVRPDSLERIELPRPASPEDALFLREGRGEPAPIYLSVDKTGRMVCRGSTIDFDSIPWPEGPAACIRLRTDRRAPWRFCRNLIRRAWERSVRVEVAFAPEVDRWERVLDVAPGGEARRTVSITSLADDPAGGVLQRMLALATDGPVGFTLE